MIPWNYNIYGIATEDFFSGTWDAPIADTESTGKLLETTTYYYFYEGQPLYSVDRDKLLEDSIYLWHVGSGSAAGTNASYCISVGDVLDLQVSQNKAEAPLSMQLTNVTNRDFSRDPRARIAYNYFNYEMINIFDSKLFVDINRTTFCNNVVVHCYRKDNNSVSQQSLSNMVNYINADPENRYVTGIELQLYHGYTLPRNTYYTAVPAVSKKGFPAVDILTERFIPDNATGVKKDLQYSFMGDENYHEDWVDNKLYAPFIMANRGIWYSGNESEGNQYYIGARTTRSVNELRNGYAQTGWSGERVTGGFMKYSDTIQEFDDVSYKWRFNIYYINGGVFLENGFPLTSIPGADRIAIYTSIEIVDSKGANMGTALQRAVKHECAFLGFYFADTLNAAQNAVLGTANNNIYLPEFINGTTTGNYFTGSEIPNVPYANETSVGSDYFRYKEGESDSDGGHLTTNHYTDTIGGSTNLFAFTATEFESLMTWLNSTYSPTDETEFIQDFKGQNPGEYIVSVKYFPFDLPSTASAPVPVYVGKINTGLLRVPYKKQIGGNSLFDLGSWECVPPYVPDDFRIDYCKMLLYIPWCGYTELDPVIFAKSPDNVYHYINVKLHVDYTTGSCMGLVYRDSQLIQCVNGTCGIDIPLSAMNQGSYQNAIKQAEIALSNAETSRVMSFLGLAGSAVATIGSGLIGNLPGLAGGIMGMVGSVGSIEKSYNAVESAQYNLEHTSPSIGNVSGASPLNNAFMDQTPILFIYRPAFLDGYDPTVYGHTIGYACNINGHLKDFNGLTVCASWDLSGIPCTAEEKTMIAQYLTGGVIM